MRSRRSTTAFLLSAALVALHLLVVGSWLSLATVVVIALAWLGLPRPLRTAVAFCFGALAVFGGFLHVQHIRWDGFARSDLTGLGLFLAGAGLFAATVLTLLERPRLPLRRRLLRGLGTLGAAVVLAAYVIAPVGAAMWLTGKPRQPLTRASLPVSHRDISFRASDGTLLSGWYVPSRNGAAVVLVHGGGGSRNGVRAQALLLARHGFGVLLYDERGRGRSGGRSQGMGWNWSQDVAAAVTYASRQAGVREVGALGLSTGAEVVVTAAAHDPRIRAVVADGLINRTLADTALQDTVDDITGLPYWWVAFQALTIESSSYPPEPLTVALARVAPRPLLIIAAAKFKPERVAAPHYLRAAGPTASLWLADTGHTHALETFPRQYERRVVGLFERALNATATGRTYR